MKYIISILASFLLLSFVFSLTPTDLTWNGLLQVELSKTTFDSNENITGNVIVHNLESFPLVDGRIVLELAQGTYDYPSQFAKDNIIYETTINNIWVLPNTSKKIDFSIPAQFGGKYRLDSYMWVVKSKMVGSSSILYNPLSTELTVKGNEVTRAIIKRDKTTFGEEKAVGPISFPISANSSFSGNVVIENPSSSPKSNLTLVLSMCDWANAFCENSKEYTFSVPTISPNSEVSVPVNLISPDLSSAYEISIVLKNNSSIESIYKSRVIVTGPTAEARKIFINGLSDQNYSITAVIAGSPDHFTNPTFENFEVGVEIYDNNSLLEKHFNEVLKIGGEDIISESFSLTTKAFNKVCVIAKKENKIYEEECFSVPLDTLVNAYNEKNPKQVSVSWAYDDGTSSLDVTLNKSLINGRIIVLDKDKTIFEESVENKLETYSVSVPTKKTNLTLIVDDSDAKRQQVFDIILDSSVVVSEQLNNIGIVDENGNYVQTVCKTQVCQENSVCNSQTYNSTIGACCPTECIPINSSNSSEDIPLVAVMAVILVILAISVVITTIKGVRK